MKYWVSIILCGLLICIGAALFGQVPAGFLPSGFLAASQGGPQVLGTAVFTGSGGVSNAQYSGIISSVTYVSSGIYAVNLSTAESRYTISFVGQCNTQPCVGVYPSSSLGTGTTWDVAFVNGSSVGDCNLCMLSIFQ